MTDSSKGFNVNIRVVAAIVLALALALVIAAGFNEVNSSTEGEISATNNSTKDKTRQSECIAECRRDNPSGGTGFMVCKAGC